MEIDLSIKYNKNVPKRKENSHISWKLIYIYNDKYILQHQHYTTRIEMRYSNKYGYSPTTIGFTLDLVCVCVCVCVCMCVCVFMRQV